MMEKERNNVYKVYDQISEWFDEHRSKELIMEKHYLDLIAQHIPRGSSILDVGCGTGEPLANYFLQQGYDYTGVDASHKMIERCKKSHPQGLWLLADMRKLQLEQHFNLVIAWHSFFHLPIEDQPQTLKLMAEFVKPKGLLVFTSGPERGEVWGNNGCYELYHASLSFDEYQAILVKNGFEIIEMNVEDPNCGEATVWVTRKATF